MTLLARASSNLTVKKIGIICLAKTRLTDDLYRLSISCCICDTHTWQRPSIFIRGKPIISSERMLHKNYGHNASAAEKKSLVGSLKRLVARKK
jgi:hypothetical protein